jgi:FixJ family two-component response regulator
MSASASIFLVDDDPFQLHFLGGILRTAGHDVEAFGHPERLLARLTPGDRGCVVLDLQMPGLNGLELQRALAARGVLLPLIFVSGHSDVPSAVAAMKGGALDFLPKPVEPGCLRDVVARALQRDTEATAERAARAVAQARWTALSAREQEVCRHFARGLLNKQIAAELNITESTAQAQRARALQKLQVSSAAELGHLLTQAGAAG